jgi:hypothetical protein
MTARLDPHRFRPSPAEIGGGNDEIAVKIASVARADRYGPERGCAEEASHCWTDAAY